MAQNAALIPLTQGYSAIVDAADFEWLNQWKWCVNTRKHTHYAQRNHWIGNGKECTVSMHRLILGASKGLVVDHIDRNGLNNTRSNLRICTQAQNVCNTKSRRGASSSYLGVHWDTRRSKWRAMIMANGLNYSLGNYPDEISAARAYDAAAMAHHGEFASKNFKD